MQLIYNLLKDKFRKFIFPSSLKLSSNTSILDIISNFNTPIQTIIEIGSSDGRYTKMLKLKFPNSKIYCIEANSSLEKLWINNLKDFSNVYLNKIAIGGEIGIQKFYLNNDSDTNSLLKPKNKIDPKIDPFMEFKSIQDVNVTSLDSFCDENQINQIDLLKMDIQGGELKALMGAENLLKNKKIKIIYSEVSFIQMYEDSPLFSDIEKFLNKFGYAFFGFYNIDYGQNDRVLYGDAIFLQNNLQSD